jgi:uncharacterized RDD family membrane protein YckC
MNSELLGSIFFLLIPLFDWLYQAIMIVAPWGGTLGDIFCGTAIVTLSGKRPGFGRASARYAAKSLNYLTFGIGMMAQPFTANKQALPDLITGTVVIRRQRRATPPPSPPPPPPLLRVAIPTTQAAPPPKP